MIPSQDLTQSIAELYAQTINTRRITPAHRQLLQEAICSPDLQDEERSAIDRLIWSTLRGRLQVVNE
ncbi:hypothetical protein [Leptolyngbya sp. PCC 6406]|uniref:hypothetical protein n=1 Tax=Leptolyngbya sp. PCC 6406 TaxID=1173264 RepID=UPI0002AC0548|nr:hypothetical protein [Leptolyngbya sp. PCC 6406]